MSEVMIMGEQGFFKQIVGLDLGGGRGKSTALAKIDLTTPTPRLVSASARTDLDHPWRDDDLTDFLSVSPETTLLCLDAPLTLPPCMRCHRKHCPGVAACPDPDVQRMHALAPGPGKGGKPRFTPYTQRPQDLELLLAGLPAVGAMDSGRGPLAARMHHLLKRLSGRYQPGVNLVEVSLPALLRMWFGEKTERGCRRGADIWTFRAGVLEAFATRLSFAVWREPILSHSHLFSAVTCAVAGLTWWQERSEKSSVGNRRRQSRNDETTLWLPQTPWFPRG